MKMLVNIDVPELGPAIAFYGAALGLKHTRTMDDDVAELTGASSVIYLLKNAAGTRFSSRAEEIRHHSHDAVRNPVRNPVRNYARHWTPVHIDFVVDDIAEATRRALDAGAIQESECIEWNGSKCITFSDPFGHGFCLISFLGDTYQTDLQE